MSEFLHGRALSDRIKQVTSGRDVWCAVAFWGHRAAELFTEDLLDAHVVCDISLGGTSERALREMGAPGNPNLRVHDGLHAKVYLSDTGLIVGSANASKNGIGFGAASPGYLEAGVFSQANSDAWRAAKVWIVKLYKAASAIDEAEVLRARKLYVPKVGGELSLSITPGSLLELAIAKPEVFDGIGFVFSSREHPDGAVDAAIERVSEEAGSDDDFKDWKPARIYTDWDEDQVTRWPKQFFGFHQPTNKLYLRGHVGRHFTEVDVFTKRLVHQIEGVNLEAASKIDQARSKQIIAALDDGRGVFQTAGELREWMLDRGI